MPGGTEFLEHKFLGGKVLTWLWPPSSSGGQSGQSRQKSWQHACCNYFPVKDIFCLLLRKWKVGLVIICHKYFGHIAAFFRDNFELSQKAIRLHPSWFLFLVSSRVMLVPQGPLCWPSSLWPSTRAVPAVLPHSHLAVGDVQRCSAPSPRRHCSSRTHANDRFCWKTEK